MNERKSITNSKTKFNLSVGILEVVKIYYDKFKYKLFVYWLNLHIGDIEICQITELMISYIDG